MGPEFWAALAKLDIRTVIVGVLLLMLFGSWMAVFYAILRGRLVARSQLTDVRADRDLWHEVAAESQNTRQAVAELFAKNTDLLDKVIVQGAITNELLNQLRAEAKK